MGHGRPLKTGRSIAASLLKYSPSEFQWIGNRLQKVDNWMLHFFLFFFLIIVLLA